LSKDKGISKYIKQKRPGFIARAFYKLLSGINYPDHFREW